MALILLRAHSDELEEAQFSAGSGLLFLNSLFFSEIQQTWTLRSLSLIPYCCDYLPEAINSNVSQIHRYVTGTRAVFFLLYFLSKYSPRKEELSFF